MKLKITTLPDERPVKVTLELPGPVHRDLLAYAELAASQSGQARVALDRLIVAMVERFMDNDRAFAKTRKALDMARRRPGTDAPTKE